MKTTLMWDQKKARCPVCGETWRYLRAESTLAVVAGEEIRYSRIKAQCANEHAWYDVTSDT